jgi:hypothetical protein
MSEYILRKVQIGFLIARLGSCINHFIKSASVEIVFEGGTYYGQERTGNSYYGSIIYPNNEFYIGTFDQYRNKNGEGLYSDNFSIYYGEFSNDKIIGHGTFYLKYGGIETGYFYNSELNGDGSRIYINTGMKWLGTFKDGYINNGVIKIKIIDGSIRQEEFLNGIHIYTTLFHNDGDICIIDEKTYENSNFSGTYTWNNGTKYKGQFRNGQPYGKGELKDIDNSLYEGHFVNGEKIGSGKIKYISGDTYTGDWYNDKKHGKGIVNFSNGCKYEGQWFDNYAHGKGVFTYANGCSYEGQWINDCAHGKGVLRYPDGSFYEGEFIDGIITENGFFKYPNGSFYEGEFINGNMDGFGVLRYPDGSFYEGYFIDGIMIGRGIFQYPNGSFYEGDFIDGKMNGHGVLRYPDGTYYEGNFIDGIITGKATFYTITDDSYIGEFFNGFFYIHSICYSRWVLFI